MASKHLAIYALAALMALMPAGTAPSGAAEGQQSPQTGPARNLPEDSTSQHTIGQGGDRLSYSATAGTLPLTNDKGETAAKVFYVAYSTGEAGRPVSFVFNGGPGAAAHSCISSTGPRVLNSLRTERPVQPVALRDNPDHWLGFTDLVFATRWGRFSRAVGGRCARLITPYYGVNQDATQ